MYEICKKQYERKIEKGTLTHEYVEKQKKNLGVFLLYEQITQEQYEELMNLLVENDPGEKN